jgi:hypothetical protein
MKFANILLAAFALVVSSQAFAKTGKIGPAGCGLGNMVFGHKDMQVLAATTNGSTYNQLFGITTGTLDCGPGVFGSAMYNYVESNKVALEKDISRGQGEAVVALAEVSGCKNQSALGAALQGRYEEIFPKADVSALQVTETIQKVIRENPAVCAPLS